MAAPNPSATLDSAKYTHGWEYVCRYGRNPRPFELIDLCAFMQAAGSNLLCVLQNVRLARPMAKRLASKSCGHLFGM